MKRTPLVFLLILIFILTSFISAFAQSAELFPGAKYDPAIPTLKAVAGHDWGERITMHHESEKYVNALAQASGGRAKLFKFGETWEGKALYYLVIGSPQNIARLEEIKAAMQRLADPRKISDTEANSLIASLPSIVWLMYSVHGNEISSTDAALMTAYHLLAAQGEAITEAAFKNSLVVIDPMQNPDGRDRFINYFRQNTGRWPDADPQSAEHNEVWPSGRVNHYLFDMNRDWFAQTQLETQARTKTYLEWFPQVLVDLHEMGSNSSYYFAPQSLPLNPNMPKFQLEWFTRLGRNNAKWFDKFRFDYFTREGYDAFYPGYGEGWPTFHGTLGMTYENASIRGLTIKRSDETTRTYRNSVQRHFVASLSTIESTANNREALLKYFYEFRKTAIDEGAKETIREFIITPGNDPNRATKLAATLMKSGIEVKRAEAAFSNPKTRDYDEAQARSREFPAGSYIVSLTQPAKRLAKTLLEKQSPLDKEFEDEQRERNRKRQNEEFYDVTAWALPLLYDVPCFMTEQPSNGNFTLLKELPKPAGRVRGEKASLAYLIPWGSQSAAMALADLFRQDVRVHNNDKAFRLNGTSFPRGTLIVKVEDNPADLYERMQKLAATYGLEIHATDSSWVDDGPNFGSRNVNYLPRPRIALAWNTPTSPNSAGWTRYLLEQVYGCQVTTIRTEQLRGADLTKYNVLILPDGFGYAGMLGDGARLKEWVQQGGTLITLANATAWAADERVKLLPTKLEKRDKGSAKTDAKPDAKADVEKKKDAAPPAQAPAKAGDGGSAIDKIIEPAEEPPSSTPGAIIRLKVDNSHWLSFGYSDTTTSLVDSNRIFSLIKLDQGTNVMIYAPEGRMLIAGLMWDDAQKQLPNKAYVLHVPLGRGGIVAFAEDPNYRAFLESMSVMFMNAVLLGPGH